ncbi:MAG: hypothetical protein MZV65_39610 [Chromatiales bacterium]|nr:hypothetical protein [Chromatiales bacterium]MCK7581144.1 hypothetical protein [Chromatiales bacterium]
MTQTTATDPLQGIRDEAQSAWENAQKFWDLWPTVTPDNAMDVLNALFENNRAFSRLAIELAQKESCHAN